MTAQANKDLRRFQYYLGGFLGRNLAQSRNLSRSRAPVDNALLCRFVDHGLGFLDIIDRCFRRSGKHFFGDILYSGFHRFVAQTPVFALTRTLEC